MKKETFDLRTWLSENREIVISKYNVLSQNEFFNGISMKEFMVQVLSGMQANNIKSATRANSILPFVMGDVVMNNSRIDGCDKITERLMEKYAGTAAAAMI